MKTLWDKFTAWLSGWPESKSKKEIEQDFLFLEEEELKKKPKKPKGLKPKKKKVAEKPETGSIPNIANSKWKTTQTKNEWKIKPTTMKFLKSIDLDIGPLISPDKQIIPSLFFSRSVKFNKFPSSSL